MNPKRPDVLCGKTPRVKTGCGWLYLTINYLDNKPFEILPNFGKSGGCGSASAEALGRVISRSLQNGTLLDDIIKDLSGIECNAPFGNVKSCYGGIASILSKNKELSPPLVEKVAGPSDKVADNPDKADTMITLLADNGEITGDRTKW